MNNAIISFALSAIFVSNALAADQAEGDIDKRTAALKKGNRPNILVVFTDDQGFADVSYHNSTKRIMVAATRAVASWENIVREIADVFPTPSPCPSPAGRGDMGQLFLERC